MQSAVGNVARIQLFGTEAGRAGQNQPGQGQIGILGLLRFSLSPPPLPSGSRQQITPRLPRALVPASRYTKANIARLRRVYPGLRRVYTGLRRVYPDYWIRAAPGEATSLPHSTSLLCDRTAGGPRGDGTRL